MRAFFLIAPVVVLFCGPAHAGEGPGGCALTGLQPNATAECRALRETWQAALQTCLQAHRVEAEVQGRGRAGHPISAPAARAQMLLCQRQASAGLTVVE